MSAHEGMPYMPKKHANQEPTLTRPTGLRIELDADTTAANTPAESREANKQTNKCQKQLNEAPDHGKVQEET